jgi:hypothetical protein
VSEFDNLSPKIMWQNTKKINQLLSSWDVSNPLHKGSLLRRSLCKSKPKPWQVNEELALIRLVFKNVNADDR